MKTRRTVEDTITSALHCACEHGGLKVDELEAALRKLEADAQALADVRTLDADSTLKRYWRTTPATGCWESCLMVWGTDSAAWRSAEQLFYGPTPDAARAAAAAWVREPSKGSV